MGDFLRSFQAGFVFRNQFLRPLALGDVSDDAREKVFSVSWRIRQYEISRGSSAAVLMEARKLYSTHLEAPFAVNGMSLHGIEMHIPQALRNEDSKRLANQIRRVNTRISFR